MTTRPPRPWTPRRDRLQAALVWTAVVLLLALAVTALLLIPGGTVLDAP